MKIYTKTGDNGETSLIGGKRVPKNHARIEAYGTIDELNSIIGMVRNFIIIEDLDIFANIQNKLFNIGSCFAVEREGSRYAIPELEGISNEDINALEQKIDEYAKDLPNLKGFILPAGSEIISWLNIARTVCRRAERKALEIDNIKSDCNNCLIFLNRLSDFLFVVGRKYANDNDIEEILWNNDV
jgi:cob(I)alamin adenosyltransferase